MKSIIYAAAVFSFALVFLESHVLAQDDNIPFLRKQATGPSSIKGMKPLPEDMVMPERPESNGAGQHRNVRVYDQIHTPIRWYALENEHIADYWAHVDITRIWLELEPGVSPNDPHIQTFLEKNGLWEIVRESPYKDKTNYYILALPESTPQQVIRMTREAQDVTGIRFLEPSAKYSGQLVPNDTYWSYQWGPYVIYSNDAWDYGTGGGWGVVAVIDDAVDWLHEDLYDQVWYGYDYGFDDWDPTPDQSSQDHGTHVTGTVAASINNGIGIAGMVNDTVYFAKVTDQTYNPENGNFSDAAIINALYDMATIGRIGVINMSLGGGAPSAAMEQACNNSWNAGQLLVVASGNDGQGTISFPAAFDACMAVGAIGADGFNLYLSSYSNYGNEQEVCAPGGHTDLGYGILSTLPGNDYGVKDGTSMACPHVAGLAGLMKSINPDLTNSDIRNILSFTASDFGISGWDNVYGYGMVQAALAVEAAQGGSVHTAEFNNNESISIYPNPSSNRIFVDTKELPSDGTFEIYDMAGKLAMSMPLINAGITPIDIANLSDGVYVLRLRSDAGLVATKFVKH